MSSKEIAKKIEGSVKRCEVRDAMTFGLYTIKRRRKVYSLPFVAPSDDIALQTVIAASHDEPSLQGAKLYRFADFLLTEGAARAFRVPKFIGVNNGR